MTNLRARLMGAFVATTVVAAISAAPAAAQETLSIGGLSGGIWGESFRNAIITPFGQQFKVQMKSEEGISGVTLAKVRLQKDNPQFDIVFIDRGVSDLGIRDGL